MYSAASGDFEFGDILSAEWSFDVHLRGDAVPLKPFESRMGRNRPSVVGYQPANESQKRDLVLAHGRRRPAMLLSDNCEIESVMVRRRAGRLIFAAIEDWPNDPDGAAQALEVTAFRRHPLPPGNGFAGGIVNLQSLFAVGQDAVANATPDPRVARLDEDAVIDLEIRWNAYATRRGPRTHQDNAVKLAMLLTADGDPEVLRALKETDPGQRRDLEELDVAAANLLAETLTSGWALEGGVLNDMADALERGDRPDKSRQEIIDALVELERLAGQAARALRATVRPANS